MIRVFPRMTKWTPTDELAFVGDPPLFRPPDDLPVRVSVTFTWDLEEGQRLLDAWSNYYSDVRIGGPAFGDPGGEFEPGRYVKQGVTITSRGCLKRCAWCFVPNREGSMRELQVKDGWIVQDNNFLACSMGHIKTVIEMLKRQKHPAEFKGGLDATLLTGLHRSLFDEIRIKEMWFACDSPAGIKPLERAAKILDGIPQYKRYCYTMIGYNGEPLANAERRLEQVYNLGFLPFAQLFQTEKRREYPQEWKTLARTWSRPAAFKTHMKGKIATVL